MRPEELLAGLGALLGIDLTPGKEGTCRLVLDEDTVDFEVSGDRLFVMADIGSAVDRMSACARFLAADHLGTETGGAVISLDEKREVFMLHSMFEAGISSAAFEERLTLFVKALRYWKAWLNALSVETAAQVPAGENFSNMLAV